ncbi:hypothetical protein T4D_1443 [Trichinella pseudospiralis]|uniref:Uncharacterized protein n=1 Tax=Trichinella pseudospiralis TaxID=6337 RepID=A0A0V1F6B7_TRIPS|nr:hypothetical protein T4D_1443 [Trichinella pseudospiralis]
MTKGKKNIPLHGKTLDNSESAEVLAACCTLLERSVTNSSASSARATASSSSYQHSQSLYYHNGILISYTFINDVNGGHPGRPSDSLRNTARPQKLQDSCSCLSRQAFGVPRVGTMLLEQQYERNEMSLYKPSQIVTEGGRGMVKGGLYVSMVKSGDWAAKSAAECF